MLGRNIIRLYKACLEFTSYGGMVLLVRGTNAAHRKRKLFVVIEASKRAELCNVSGIMFAEALLTIEALS